MTLPLCSQLYGDILASCVSRFSAILRFGTHASGMPCGGVEGNGSRTLGEAAGNRAAGVSLSLPLILCLHPYSLTLSLCFTSLPPFSRWL